MSGFGEHVQLVTGDRRCYLCDGLLIERQWVVLEEWGYRHAQDCSGDAA